MDLCPVVRVRLRENDIAESIVGHVNRVPSAAILILRYSCEGFAIIHS